MRILDTLRSFVPYRSGKPTADPVLGPSRSAKPFLVEPQNQYQALVNTLSNVYSSRWDEAIRHFRVNAAKMKNDAYLTALFEERTIPLTRWSWQIDHDGDPDQPDDNAAENEREQLTLILGRTYRLWEMRDYLREAVWYGRYGSQVVWDRLTIGGEPRWSVVNHVPVDGDSVLTEWSGLPAVAVNPMTLDRGWGDSVRQTSEGHPVLVLDKPEHRERFLVHRHRVRAGNYFDPFSAGMVGGSGLRHQVYWNWWLRDQIQKDAVSFADKLGMMGLLVVYYEEGNAQSLQKAQEMIAGAGKQAGIAVPRPKSLAQNQTAGVEIIPAQTAGADFLVRIVTEWLEKHIERLFVGQSLSAGTEGSGLGGSGVAGAHMDTKFQLLQADAEAMAATLTEDLLRVCQRLNFPGSEYRFKWVFNVPDPSSDTKLQAVQTAWSMGVDFDKNEVRRLTGLAKPETDADRLENPQFAEQPGDGMMMGDGEAGDDPDELEALADKLEAGEELTPEEQATVERLARDDRPEDTFARRRRLVLYTSNNWEAPADGRKQWRRPLPGGGYEYRDEPPGEQRVRAEETGKDRNQSQSPEHAERIQSAVDRIKAAAGNDRNPKDSADDYEAKVEAWQASYDAWETRQVARAEQRDRLESYSPDMSHVYAAREPGDLPGDLGQRINTASQQFENGDAQAGLELINLHLEYLEHAVGEAITALGDAATDRDKTKVQKAFTKAAKKIEKQAEGYKSALDKAASAREEADRLEEAGPGIPEDYPEPEPEEPEEPEEPDPDDFEDGEDDERSKSAFKQYEADSAKLDAYADAHAAWEKARDKHDREYQKAEERQGQKIEKLREKADAILSEAGEKYVDNSDIEGELESEVADVFQAVLERIDTEEEKDVEPEEPEEPEEPDGDDDPKESQYARKVERTKDGKGYWVTTDAGKRYWTQTPPKDAKTAQKTSSRPTQKSAGSRSAVDRIAVAAERAKRSTGTPAPATTRNRLARDDRGKSVGPDGSKESAGASKPATTSTLDLYRRISNPNHGMTKKEVDTANEVVLGQAAGTEQAANVATNPLYDATLGNVRINYRRTFPAPNGRHKTGFQKSDRIKHGAELRKMANRGQPYVQVIMVGESGNPNITPGVYVLYNTTSQANVFNSYGDGHGQPKLVMSARDFERGLSADPDGVRLKLRDAMNPTGDDLKKVLANMKKTADQGKEDLKANELHQELVREREAEIAKEIKERAKLLGLPEDVVAKLLGEGK
jgi:hypothetical protein